MVSVLTLLDRGQNGDGPAMLGDDNPLSIAGPTQPGAQFILQGFDANLGHMNLHGQNNISTAGNDGIVPREQRIALRDQACIFREMTVPSLRMPSAITSGVQ